MGNLILGLITGIFFGFFLQKGQALKYDRQLGMLRLRDFTLVKLILTAILVGMAGVYFFVDLGVAKLSIKPTVLGANIIGGLIFGLGWGMLGYCPGTAVGATAEGRWDAFWGGVLGMLVGAGIFAEVYPAIKDTLLKWGDFGKLTLPSLLGVNHWVIIVLAWMAMGLILLVLEKRKL
ncbi:MAG: hypothetical protein H6Q55_2949 [Deltaproteobacteria bacterium]|nr:hypothetical protein [Deltaproteobacteria bacterium]